MMRRAAGMMGMPDMSGMMGGGEGGDAGLPAGLPSAPAAEERRSRDIRKENRLSAISF